MDTGLVPQKLKHHWNSIHRTPSLFLVIPICVQVKTFIKPWLDAWMVLKLRQIRPDVIHVPDVKPPLAAMLGKLITKHLRGVPIVYSAHNTMGEELSTYFQGTRTKRWMTCFGALLDHTIPRLADRHWFFERSLYPYWKVLGLGV